MRESHGIVVHVAAAEAEPLDTLRHTMRVIAALGVGQVLLVLGEAEGAALPGCAALAAETRRLSFPGPSVGARARALGLELSRIARERSLYAVHLHGVWACLLGSRALRTDALRFRLLYSPHLAEAASPWGTALLRGLMRPRLELADGAALTASLTDAPALSRLLNRSAEVLPYPVTGAFFDAAREEGARPRVLADGRGDAALDLVARLCVLLNGREARVRFSWLGDAGARGRARLEASGIEVPGHREDADKAQALARASVFVHVSGEPRLPVPVLQAMAAGVPCLVSDTPAHRSVIRHGETGLVCTSSRELLDKLVMLLRDRAERRRLGEAARAEAARCFTQRHFEAAVLRAYGLSAGTALRAPAAMAAAGLHAG